MRDLGEHGEADQQMSRGRLRFPERRTRSQWLLLVMVGGLFTFTGCLVIVLTISGVPLRFEDGSETPPWFSLAGGLAFGLGGIYVLITPDHAWIDLDGGRVCGWAEDSHKFRTRSQLEAYDRVVLETNVVADKESEQEESDDEAEMVDWILYLAGAESQLMLESFDDVAQAENSAARLAATLSLPLERAKSRE